MELVGAGAVIAAILLFGLLCARFGVAYVSEPRQRASFVRSLPWWYIGGQPELQIPPPDEDDASERLSPPGRLWTDAWADDAAVAASERGDKEPAQS